MSTSPVKQSYLESTASEEHHAFLNAEDGPAG